MAPDVKVAMKRLLTIFAAMALLLAAGCSKYDDSALSGRLDDLEGRIAQLEELCKQTNTNISSLQTVVSAVQNGDYIKEVTPVMQDGKEIGYTITFEKCDPITIYHGKGGDKGENGAMPVIGVRQDEDGVYRWTLNGEWLLDDSGNKIELQTIPPKLKLENGYWYVSYDGEQTWEQFGKATSDDSDLMFQQVTQDDRNVYFTLASGEKITVPKMSGLAISFKLNDLEIDSLRFSNGLTRYTIHYTITGGDTNKIVIKIELLNNDGGYTLKKNAISATTGTIDIHPVEVPTTNRVIVSVSDGRQTIMAAIDLYLPPFDGHTTINDVIPGYLKYSLIYDPTTIQELTITGSLNDEDIATLAALPNLSVLDIEDTDLTELPEKAFYDHDSLTSVKLPKTLKTIGDQAFLGCNGITSITIPEGVTTIGDAAFYGSGLTSIIIPNSVTTIKRAAFMHCYNLTSLVLSENITTIENQVFGHCLKLTGDLIIPKGVTTIGDESFTECPFTGKLVIPETVTKIGLWAFVGGKVQNIYCQAKTPPQLGSSFGYDLKAVKLYVPTGCAEAYRTAKEWKNYTFKDIIETDF